MRKYLLIIALLILFLCLSVTKTFSSSIDSTKQKKWRWGVNASLLHGSYYFNNYNKSDIWTKKVVDYCDSIVKPTIGFSLGVNAEKFIWKNVSLKAGFSFTRLSFNTKWQCYTKSLGPSNGFITTYYLDNCFLYYFSLPISANYYFLTKNKISLFIGIGVTPCIPNQGNVVSVNQYNTFTNANNSSGLGGTTESIPSPLLDGTGNLGLNLHFSKFNITIAATINHSLVKDEQTLIGTYTFSQHLYTYGLNACISF
jgi:hypothetical protein